MRLSFSAIAIALALSACANTPPTESSELGRWAATQINGVPTMPSPQPFLTLGDNAQIYGSGGCNGFLGTYDRDGDEIKIADVEITVIACGSPPRGDIHEQENRFLRALTGSFRVTSEGDSMVFTRDDGLSIAFVRH